MEASLIGPNGIPAVWPVGPDSNYVNEIAPIPLRRMVGKNVTAKISQKCETAQRQHAMQKVNVYQNVVLSSAW